MADTITTPAPIPAVAVGTPPALNAGLTFTAPPPARKAPVSQQSSSTTDNKVEAPATREPGTLSMDDFKDNAPANRPSDSEAKQDVDLSNKSTTTDNKEATQPAKSENKTTLPPVTIPPYKQAAKIDNKAEDGKADARDYSMFSEEELPFVKKTSNETYEFLKKTIPEYKNKLKEAEEIKKVASASIYADPRAVVLTKEYSEASKELNFLGAEEQIWRDQLLRVKRGEAEVYRLTGFKGTQPHFEKVAVTQQNVADLEIEFGEALQTVASNKNQVSAYINNIQANHNQRFTGAVNALRKAESQYFGIFDDPKHPRWAEINQFKTYIDPAFQSHPLADTVAKSYGFIREMAAYVETLQAKVNKYEQLSSDRRNGGPTEESTVGGGSDGKPSERMLSMKMFND